MKFEISDILKNIGLYSFSGFMGGMFKAMTSKIPVRSKEVLKQAFVGGIASAFLGPIMYITFFDNSLISSSDDLVRTSMQTFIGFITGFSGKEAGIYLSKKVFKNGKNNDNGK